MWGFAVRGAEAFWLDFSLLLWTLQMTSTRVNSTRVCNARLKCHLLTYQLTLTSMSSWRTGRSLVVCSVCLKLNELLCRIWHFLFFYPKKKKKSRLPPHVQHHFASASSTPAAVPSKSAYANLWVLDYEEWENHPISLNYDKLSPARCRSDKEGRKLKLTPGWWLLQM